MRMPPKSQKSSSVAITGRPVLADEVPGQRGPAHDALRPPIPAGEVPTAAAELRFELRQDGGQDEGTSADRGRRLPGWLLWLVPAAIVLRVTVPAADSVPLLRMLERVTFAIAWPSGVIGTLFGASAAHLPPIGTTALIALELVIPAAVLRGRRGA
jgi:hypothetical protein